MKLNKTTHRSEHSHQELIVLQQPAVGLANHGREFLDPLHQVRVHQGAHAAPREAVPEAHQVVAHLAPAREPQLAVVAHQDRVLPLIVSNRQQFRFGAPALSTEARRRSPEQQPQAKGTRLGGALFRGRNPPVVRLVGPVPAEPAHLHGVQVQNPDNGLREAGGVA